MIKLSRVLTVHNQTNPSLAFCALTALLFVSCSPAEFAADAIPTPSSSYSRNVGTNDPAYQMWEQDYSPTHISAGWRWGYAASNCKRNNISFNHVHDIGQGLLSDMGGIYTLGPSDGTVVRGNVLHDINSYSYGGWGFYADEGSSGILLEDNLVYDTKTGDFHQHYGRENILRNNIFADAGEQQLQLTRVENHLSFTFERNIVYWTNSSPALAGPWEDNRQLTRSNCYWNASGQAVSFAGKSLPDWQRTPVHPLEQTNGVGGNSDWVVSGRELGSIVADPLFVNAAQHDFHLKRGSPARRLGFKPFDYSLAGVYGDRA